ncbi:hypothetical protein CSAL01_01077 [Colletotrichum salicis]|uniref:Uncharacterized protein n=1 Tax=Colletotrichum salicis TaxID=1209931 RepID=A0A135T0D9_9PEZI|nr:hypothetical protein CSAL01_01077 [Colletotrichum salicis]
MSLQKAVASVLSVTQETSLALANLHFDFSLFKVEAPQSFKGLGNELTLSRKKAAEEGTPHVTARKLGALFQELLPSTPALIQAYGQRVTQVASRRDVNPKAARAHGLFADHVGIDGTSIWAAATSGPDAIAVHLLTCLLARIWTAPEAISIWVELVANRKRELENSQQTEALHSRSVEASRISVSRDQLAEWDASARAWLRAADEAMTGKQSQLMLILNNINIPVNKKPSVYLSVIDAWKSSLLAADKLVQGMPQSIQDGSVLLGLASWHIYPDMVVLGGAHKEIRQKDNLVPPGGLLTIGLEFKASEQAGVHWSLPLSHLRYYGRPVVTERSLEDQGNRVNVDQLNLVALGSFTRSWKLSPCDIAKGIGHIWDLVDKDASAYCAPGTGHWLELFSRATEPLLELDNLTKKSAMQLMKYGERRVPNFVFPYMKHYLLPPMFGLLDRRKYFSLLTLSGKIEALRHFASQLQRISGATFVIRYRTEDLKPALWEYTTALPVARPRNKRTAEGDMRNASGHIRWLRDMKLSRTSAVAECGEEAISFDSDGLGIFEEFATSHATERDRIMWQESIDNSCLLPRAKAQDYGDWTSDPSTYVQQGFYQLIGDQSATLFWSRDPLESKSATDRYIPPTSIDLEELLLAINGQRFNKGKVIEYLQDFLNAPERFQLKDSFRALATIGKVYKLLPDATIGLGVTSVCLYEMPWAGDEDDEKPIDKFSAFSMDWSETFSCIVLLESGSLIVPPDACVNVMAISVGDSLYVAAPLLCDPSETPEAIEVRRIRGNIGTAGIAMLIPPAPIDPPEYDCQQWNLINHAPYNGRQENSFESTSLHLSFTGMTLPIDTKTQRYRDTELYYKESRVTVHDHGREVGDLDIMGSLQSLSLSRTSACRHEKESRNDTNETVFDNDSLVTIDNWYEYLDPPETAAVARSSGNWLGRLALSVLGVQLGYRVIVSEGEFCWRCVADCWRYRQVKKVVAQDSRQESEETPQWWFDKHRVGEESFEMVTDADKLLSFDAGSSFAEAEFEATVLPEFLDDEGVNTPDILYHEWQKSQPRDPRTRVEGHGGELPMKPVHADVKEGRVTDAVDVQSILIEMAEGKVIIIC